MLYIILSIATAYLLGLAILGYVCALWLLQNECKNGKLRPLLKNILMLTHFCFGVTGMLILPSFLYGKIKANLTSEIGITFAVAEFAVLSLIFLVVKELNRKFQKFEDPEVQDPN
jgi:hypothetical protein